MSECTNGEYPCEMNTELSALRVENADLRKQVEELEARRDRYREALAEIISDLDCRNSEEAMNMVDLLDWVREIAYEALEGGKR